MNPELEKYIDMALVDGVITEDEKAFLIKKADQLGVEKDEFDFILNAKIQMKQKEFQESVPPPPPQNVSANTEKKSQKEGTTKKCPSCGAPVESFNTKCSDCGHEFRNTEAAFTVQKLNDELMEIEEVVRKDYFDNKRDRDVFPKGGLQREEKVMMKMQAQIDQEIEAACADRKLSFISTFPIPNTKEDILEILAIGIPEAKRKLSFWDKVGQSKGKMKKAWLAKCEQIIIKARFSMKDDKKTLEEIEHYAKQIGV
ncbi:zinc ribbon domain-containing protein [Flavobacteriaceae bacterium]|nr:zinc ribbon domain-containing protein [Flavobacteriaceae bacterium]